RGGPAESSATRQKRMPRRQSRTWRAPKGDARRRRAARGYGVAVPECRGVAPAPVAAPGVPSTQAPDRARSFRNLRKDAMRLLAVIAFAQQGEEVGHDEERRRGGEQQAADDGARQRGVLLLAWPADRHRNHA